MSLTSYRAAPSRDTGHQVWGVGDQGLPWLLTPDVWTSALEDLAATDFPMS